MAKAAILQTPGEGLVIGDVELADPAPHEVLIDTKACGLCHSDLHFIDGSYPHPLPAIPGHEAAGVVRAVGSEVRSVKPGDHVVSCLSAFCGQCEFCRSDRENLCEAPDFTGWTAHGGFADAMVAPADFVYPLPDGFGDLQAAPLLCAGIIGYRCLAATGIRDWSGARLGLYGFGAAGHVAIQIARARGAEVYVSSRDRDRHQDLAQELGAVWVGMAMVTSWGS